MYQISYLIFNSEICFASLVNIDLWNYWNHLIYNQQVWKTKDFQNNCSKIANIKKETEINVMQASTLFKTSLLVLLTEFDNTSITHHSASKQIILRKHWKLIFGLRLKVVQWDVNGWKRECRLLLGRRGLILNTNIILDRP
jgi:hypothetical protein